MATTQQKKIRWWQSIRGRLALGSMLVTLLAVCSLMLTAIIAIVFYYENDMRQRMSELASSGAQQVGVEYTALMNSGKIGNPPLPGKALSQAAALLHDSLDQQYLMVVFNQSSTHPVYPHPAPAASSSNGTPASNGVTSFLRQLGFDQQAGDMQKLHQAILNARRGVATSDVFSRGWLPQPYVARPIYEGGESSSPVVG